MRAEQLGLDWDAPGLIAGVDEAGRGPLAGPVVAAAVILDPGRRIVGLRDSKVLTALRRDVLHDRIREHALCCGVGIATVEEIDRINILQATLLAMQRAVRALRLTPHKVVVDGNRLPVLPMLAEAIVDGDAKVRAISAASIIAKVTRDRMCAELHTRHPQYGFDVHKGYATAVHLEALRTHGPCEVHRRTFAPVRRWAAPEADQPPRDAASAADVVAGPIREALRLEAQQAPSHTRTRSARRAGGGLDPEEPSAW